MKLAKLLLLMTILVTTSCKLIDEPMQKMDDMKTGMDNLESGTGRLTGMQRTGVGAQIRASYVESMNESESLEQKVTAAGTYMVAYEYQIWTNDETVGDNEERRFELMTQACEQYFRLVRENWNALRKKDYISPSSTKNAALNLFALSLTLHKIHLLQKDFIEGSIYKEVTMYSMIKDALSKGAAIEAGLMDKHELREHEHIILTYAPEARLLLEMRHNILIGMSLASVSNIKKDYSSIYAGIPELFTKLRHLLVKWDSKFTELNIATQEEVNKWLRESIAVRDFMRDAGLKPTTDENLKKIFKKMKLAACEDCDNEIDAQINEFLENIDNLINK